jgi:hypothetical protein
MFGFGSTLNTERGIAASILLQIPKKERNKMND